jgi:hypothetical protein
MTETAKLFTPEEASRTLPLVGKIVEDILATGSAMRERSAHPNPTAEQVDEYDVLAAKLRALMDELEALGCYYKDWSFEVGLVDFPSVIDGREVLLCWRSDEPRLQYYHGLDEGFAGRMLIPDAYL